MRFLFWEWWKVTNYWRFHLSIDCLIDRICIYTDRRKRAGSSFGWLLDWPNMHLYWSTKTYRFKLRLIAWLTEYASIFWSTKTCRFDFWLIAWLTYYTMFNNSKINSDFFHQSYLKPKWVHHPQQINLKKEPEPRISEYEDRFRLLSTKQWTKATTHVEVSVKANARRSAGFAKNIIKPPMFTQTMYSSTFKHHTPPLMPPVTPKWIIWPFHTESSFLFIILSNHSSFPTEKEYWPFHTEFSVIFIILSNHSSFPTEKEGILAIPHRILSHIHHFIQPFIFSDKKKRFLLISKSPV